MFRAGGGLPGCDADLSKPDQIRAMVAKVQGSLGVISVLQWSAYAGTAGDLTTATSAELSATLDVAVTGLVAAVQATLPDLRATKGAVLVTNGGLGFFDPKLDAMAVEWNAMGLSVANSAKHKAAAMLAHKLKPDGVYVGEIMVTGTIKGTAFDQGNATIAASTISEKFWQLYQDRTQASVTI